MKNDLSDLTMLDDMKEHPVSEQIDNVFKSVIKEEKVMQKKEELAAADPGEISLGEIEELDIGLGGDDDLAPLDSALEEGLELSLDDDQSLDLGEAEYTPEEEENDGQYGNLSLDEGEEVSLEDAEPVSDEDIENLGELSFDEDLGESVEETPDLPSDDLSLDSGNDDEGFELGGVEEESLDLGDASEPSLSEDEGLSLDIGEEPSDDELILSESSDQNDLSDDALEKLKEIDAIMEFDASQVQLQRENIPKPEEQEDSDLNHPLVSEDLDLDSLDFSTEEEAEEEPVIAAPPLKEEKKKKKKGPEVSASQYSEELKEISGAYSGEMERMQATISNLRSDRDELLMKIQKLEEDKVLQSRQGLTVRAELDEKKIELTIIRKKLHEFSTGI